MNIETRLKYLPEEFFSTLPLRTLSTCMKIAKEENLNLIDRLMKVSLTIHIDVYDKKPIGLKKTIVLGFCTLVARIMYLFTKTVTPKDVHEAFAFNPSTGSGFSAGMKTITQQDDSDEFFENLSIADQMG